MAKKFGALADFRQAQTDETMEQPPESTPLVIKIPGVAENLKGRGRPAGKRSNPDFEPTTVLLRKQTKRRASRLLEDTESSQDLSDLIREPPSRVDFEISVISYLQKYKDLRGYEVLPAEPEQFKTGRSVVWGDDLESSLYRPHPQGPLIQNTPVV